MPCIGILFHQAPHRLRFEDMLAQGDGGRLGAVRGSQLLEERDRVLPHGGRRDAELFRDVVVRKPSDDRGYAE